LGQGKAGLLYPFLQLLSAALVFLFISLNLGKL
jgi:hypothetical protein